MYKKGFTLIELITALYIIATACCIISTSYIYSVKQRRKSEETQHEILLCSAILDCFKSKGSMAIKNIYDSSPRSPQEDASWCICFDTMDEIKNIINDLVCFPEYCDFPNITSGDNGKRYAVFIKISIREDFTSGLMEYPVKIQLIDCRHDSSLPMNMDYEFISDL